MSELTANTKKKYVKTKLSLKIIIIFLLSIIFICICGGLFLLHKYYHDANLLKLNTNNTPITSSISIVDKDNHPLQNNTPHYNFIPAHIGKNQDINQLYVNTLVNLEDETFYTRHTLGFSPQNLMGAGLSYMSHGMRRGGSTLSQQLAKMLTKGTNISNNMNDKIIQFIDAYALEAHYSKNDIIQAYINSLRLTNNTIGVKAAAEDLFSIDMQKMDIHNPQDIAKIAYMAGLGQSPTLYTQDFNKSGKERAHIVISVMVKHHLITPKLAKDTNKFIDSKDFKFNQNQLSSVDKTFQPYVWQTMQELDQQKLPKNAQIVVHTYADSDKIRTLQSVIQGTYQLHQNIPEGFIPNPTHTMVSLASIESTTGHIVALNTNNDDPSIVSVSNRSSGSTIKPVLDYGPALQYNRITPNTILNGTSGMNDNGWKVVNFGGESVGPVTASKALAMSLNTSAVQVFKTTSQAEKERLLSPMGLTMPKLYSDEMAIDFPISPLQNASAFSSLSNDGIRVEPTTIQSIELNGKPLKLKTPRTYRTMDSRVAKTLYDMLQGIYASYGTDPYANPKAIGLPTGQYALKSGLSSYAINNYYTNRGAPDAWMNFTSPNYTISAWEGDPNAQDPKMAGVYCIPDGNNGRVYISNSAIQVLMAGQQPRMPIFTNGILSTSEGVTSNIPSLANIDTSKHRYNPKKDFKPINPTIKPDDQNQYNKDNDENNQLKQRLAQTYKS